MFKKILHEFLKTKLHLHWSPKSKHPPSVDVTTLIFIQRMSSVIGLIRTAIRVYMAPKKLMCLLKQKHDSSPALVNPNYILHLINEEASVNDPLALY